MLTGLLGGSFNPAHGGHRRISLFAREALALDEVWWLVSPGNVLKPAAGMAPLDARFASARKAARGAPIRVTAVETNLGTRYTIDTLRKLKRRYPKRRFIWLMGTDNLAQFHRWRGWRKIAREMPIAVVARPGYDASALASPAMAWLRRWRRQHSQNFTGANWSAPALVILRFDPDARSATALRAADPEWHCRAPILHQRDMLTHRPITTSAGMGPR
ncbi:putative nicotinate-nucleotide adenylyltransferase [Novosphingobium sediminis]|uniref:Probable nicotinate-nucleotide adenylyltransferase n=1 Tax=Novosphingobium sediminis TaxID=707214 RepID=A0A512AKI1_9SPHN|nr:nicotinate-nucleotide adenylyltransferase [Novosphingobium sediminis]GEO00193.1 putative nicotinate-nucleotide adenylyltransferase [Novosphingobium sediminis]